MRIAVIEIDELKALLRETVREELKALTEYDEIGGVEMAAQITGLKPDTTIYKKWHAGRFLSGRKLKVAR